MKTELSLLETLLDRVIDYSTDLLELGYSINDTLKYGLSYIYKQKEDSNLSTQDFVELEYEYVQLIHVIS